MTKVGKAYAFFDCKASKQQIEEVLPRIRARAKTPSELEISLAEGPENISGDNKLMAIAREAKQAGIRYAMEATYPGATNRQTAAEVSAVLNQAYQSPLYANKEHFRGEILFKENGRYKFKE